MGIILLGKPWSIVPAVPPPIAGRDLTPARSIEGITG
jgi:hypothetical protein